MSEADRSSPSREPSDGVPGPDDPAPPHAPGPPPPPGPPPSDVDDALDLAAKHASESAREWLTAVKESFEKALDKDYDAQLLAKDVAAFWARAVRDGARAATDAALVARALAAHVPEPAPGPTAPTVASGPTAPTGASGATP